MTLISPVPKWWAHWLRGVWAYSMWRLGKNPNAYPFGALTRLAFIHFAHWSLVDRVPSNSPTGTPLPYPYLFFQTNFNRGWKEYVEAFCLVIPTAMRMNWRGAYGFPDPRPVGPFLDYVEQRFTPAAHFYCAYPDVSTRMVIEAIDSRSRFDFFAGESVGPPTKFMKVPHRARGITTLGGNRTRTDTISVLTPIKEHQADELRDLLKKLPPDSAQSPLARVETTHMARWSVVSPLPAKDSGPPQSDSFKPINSVSYLLFTAWFDGETSKYLHDLGSELPAEVDQIWGRCVGYPGRADMQAFCNYMEEHCIKPGLAFGGYPQAVSEVRAGIALRDELTPEVVKASGLDTEELERAWRESKEWPGPA